jgi:hypothetical protein
MGNKTITWDPTKKRFHLKWSTLECKITKAIKEKENKNKWLAEHRHLAKEPKLE